MESLTELEDILREDTKGENMRKLIISLNLSMSDFSIRMRIPNPPEIYHRIERQRAACKAAVRIIKQIWLFHHRGVMCYFNNDVEGNYEC